MDPCPRRHRGAGRSVARKRAGCALPLRGTLPDATRGAEAHFSRSLASNWRPIGAVALPVMLAGLSVALRPGPAVSRPRTGTRPGAARALAPRHGCPATAVATAVAGQP